MEKLDVKLQRSIIFQEQEQREGRAQRALDADNNISLGVRGGTSSDAETIR